MEVRWLLGVQSAVDVNIRCCAVMMSLGVSIVMWSMCDHRLLVRLPVSQCTALHISCVTVFVKLMPSPPLEAARHCRSGIVMTLSFCLESQTGWTLITQEGYFRQWL